MRFLIAGPGAVGGFVAARLAEGGHDVTVLARPRRAAWSAASAQPSSAA
jgi:ketopantoate reductase